MKCETCGMEPQSGAVRIGDRFWCVSVVQCLTASYEAEKATGERRAYITKAEVRAMAGR